MLKAEAVSWPPGAGMDESRVFAVTGGSWSYLLSLHLFHNPLESTGSFSHELLPFRFEYRQVRSQFMNWLCFS